VGFLIRGKPPLWVPPPPPGSQLPQRTAQPERNPFHEPLPGLLGEAEDDHNRWLEAASEFLRGLFKDAKLRVGEDEARRLFVRATKRRRGEHGRQQVGRSPTRDADLLYAYDEAIRHAQTDRERRATPRHLAGRLAAESGPRYGNSAQAIERHLRRLLADRKRQAEASAELFRQWREAYKEATGREPEPGLLRAGPDTK
jgi:hypothetical protein